VLEAGEMLYIPEGWWHYVVSEPNTLAVNFWLESVFTKI
jgi:ribosomal protein L16 Arg81 hydroxylase